MEYSEAKRLGLKTYNTGRPCRKGHTVDRYTSTRTCIRCQYECMSKWVRGNRKRHNEHGREWLARHPEYRDNDEYRAKNRNEWRAARGFPTPTRPTPLNCELCDCLLTGGVQTHLDHDHVTGKFRGWLCNRCNRGLGHFGDTIAGLERAIAYLKRAES